jgi:hypothetical protein
VRAYPPFVKAMKKRGLDVDNISIDPWCPGYFTPADDPAKRLARCALVIAATWLEDHRDLTPEIVSGHCFITVATTRPATICTRIPLKVCAVVAKSPRNFPSSAC